MTRDAVRIGGIARRYDWGSVTAIPALIGVAPTGQPLAELWFGAHPDDPADVVEQGVTLDEWIERDPAALLGPASRARFGDGLPFLLKLLAADRALSIQVHPSLAQARARYAAERAAHPDGPFNYQDANHKPELICALTPFKALCGFRPVRRTRQLLAVLRAADPAADLLAELDARLARPDGLREAFTWLLRLPAAQAAEISAVTARACGLVTEGEWAGATSASVIAAGDFPGDIGVVVALLLNFVELQPGEAIFLAAGNVHCYLRGLGVEIMANSDNVLRCGLTHKRIDVDELLRITDFSELLDPCSPALRVGGVRQFDIPVPDFALSEIDLPAADGVAIPVPARGTPRILLGTSGRTTVHFGGGELDVGQGEAVFLSAAAQALVSGKGTIFCAAVGV